MQRMARAPEEKQRKREQGAGNGEARRRARGDREGGLATDSD